MTHRGARAKINCQTEIDWRMSEASYHSDFDQRVNNFRSV